LIREGILSKPAKPLVKYTNYKATNFKAHTGNCKQRIKYVQFCAFAVHSVFLSVLKEQIVCCGGLTFYMCMQRQLVAAFAADCNGFSVLLRSFSAAWPPIK
jgi:hypothetical protein